MFGALFPKGMLGCWFLKKHVWLLVEDLSGGSRLCRWLPRTGQEFCESGLEPFWAALQHSFARRKLPAISEITPLCTHGPLGGPGYEAFRSPVWEASVRWHARTSLVGMRVVWESNSKGDSTLGLVAEFTAAEMCARRTGQGA